MNMLRRKPKFTKFRLEPLPGFIYLLSAVGTNSFKIGRALDVATRIQTLQTSSPVKIRYVYHVYVTNTAICEMDLHNHFNHLRQIGEWFTFAEDDVKACIKLMRLAQVPEISYEKPFYPQIRRARPVLVVDDEEAKKRIAQLLGSGWGKAKIILEVWGVSKGGSPKYKAAEAEYKRLVGAE
jgi:hypothetical protein